MKLKSVFLAVAIVISSVIGTSVFARSATEPRVPLDETKTVPKSAPARKDEPTPDTKLKRDMQKLLADARAGKVAPRPQRLPNGGRYNLSTGAKIGIIAAIAGGIFAIIVIHQVNSD